MNIKDRLKRMESEIISNSDFCACNGEGEQFVLIKKEPILYDPYATGEYLPYSSESDNLKETPVEICSECKKAINKRVVYLQGVLPIYENKEFEA